MTDTTGANTGQVPVDVSASSRVQKVSDQAKQLGADAASHANDVIDDVKQRAGSLMEDAKSGVVAAAQESKGGLADKLDDVAQAAHRSGEQLEGHQDWLARLVERGADELASLASTVRNNDLKGLMTNLEDLARRQPAVFIGASMAAGFAMVRLGKVAVSGISRDDLPTVPEIDLDHE
jgi:hypothetical protein